MDCAQCGRAVKDKATTEKTGNSMSSGLRAYGREAGGRGTQDGALPPVTIELRTLATMVGGRGQWWWWRGVQRGHTEHARNAVPFNVPSERAQLTPGTNKSRGMRLC